MCVCARLCFCSSASLFPLIFAAVLWFELEHFKPTVAKRGHTFRCARAHTRTRTHTLKTPYVKAKNKVYQLSVCGRSCPFWHPRLNLFCWAVLKLNEMSHHIYTCSINTPYFLYLPSLCLTHRHIYLRWHRMSRAVASECLIEIDSGGLNMIHVLTSYWPSFDKFDWKWSH